MWTVVFLAAFLLAASANPIANSREDSIEDAKDTHTEEASPNDEDSELSTGEDTANDTKQQDTAIGNSAGSSEDESEGSTGGVTDNNTKEQDTSIDKNAGSTEDAGEGNEDSAASNGGDALTSSVTTVSTTSTQGGDKTNPTEITATSSDSTVYTTSTKPETSSQQSNESESTPADADPTDCRNATEANHIYLECTYSCQQDEMFTAPNNSLCYLYPPGVMTNNLISQEDNHTEHVTNETGVCLDGRCVRSSSETPAAPTESSPADTSTQQSNETYTTPSDADPKDCRNATEENHIYVLCTYTCQQDEMFTAPNNSVCYLHPPLELTDILINEEDNRTEHSTNETGVCVDGRCVRRTTETPTAPTQSLPTTTTTTTTAAETDFKTTENSVSEQTSLKSGEPNDASGSLPVSSQTQNTHTENIGNPRNQENEHLPQEEKSSSTATDGPALPAIRD